MRNIRYRTTRNEDTRCYFCKNNCLRTFIDVDVTASKSHDHDHTLLQQTAQLRKRLPRWSRNCRASNKSRRTCLRSSAWFFLQHRRRSQLQRLVFKAKVEPLIQIQMSPGSSKVVELPKPVDFQPRKTKVPLRVGEQRLIIATCEKGTVEDLADMKDIKADIDKIKEANPNYVDIAARDVFRHRQVEVVADAVPSTKGLFISKAVKERAAADGEAQGVSHRHSAPAQYLHLCAAVQCLLRQPRAQVGEHHLLRLHHAGALPRRRKPRRHRSLLSLKDRHRACLQPARNQAQQEAASTRSGSRCTTCCIRHLVNLTGSNACPTVTATPETVKAAFTKESESSPRTASSIIDPILNLQDQRICADQMFKAWGPILGLSREENERALEAGFKALARLRS